jgi:Ca-activated chloride channel homolog
MARAGEPVAVELVLALDTSASVDSREFALETGGLVAAFRDPDVIAAIDNLKPLGAAISVIQWGGPGDSKVAVPWIRIGSAREAKAFAHVLSRMQRWQKSSVTSIRSAMADGKAMIDTGDYEGVRRVIDISGDGADNSSLDLHEVRNQVHAAGITINGLAIEAEDARLTSYYRDNVIIGSGCFVETARDYSDFARAIKEKLLRELKPIES